MTTITSRDFNHDVSAAKRAAQNGPVTITEHGQRSHMLLTVEQYDRLIDRGRPVGDRLKSQTPPAPFDLPERVIDDSRVPEL